MKIFKFLILHAIVLALGANYTFGAITGISILNSHFRVEGYTQDDSYLVEDPIYASGSTRYSPYSTEFASSEAGFVTLGSEEFLIASAQVEGVTAFARGWGTIDFSSIADSLTLTPNMGSAHDYGRCTLMDLTTGEILFQTIPYPTFQAQSFTWVPDITHMYELALDVELSGGYGTMDTHLYVEIIPEPATLFLFALGAFLAGRKKRA